MFERINLVPQLALAGKIRKLIPVVCITLLVIGGLIVFMLGRQLDTKNNRLSNELQLLQNRQKGQEQLQTTVVQMNNAIKQLQEQERELYKVVANLEQIPKRKLQHAELLLNLASVIPSTVRCEKIEINDRKGQLFGKAMAYRDLPAFVQKLNSMPRFHSVSLQVLQQSTEEKDQLFAFNIIFGIRQ